MKEIITRLKKYGKIADTDFISRTKDFLVELNVYMNKIKTGEIKPQTIVSEENIIKTVRGGGGRPARSSNGWKNKLNK